MGRKISDEGGYCSVSVRTRALNLKGNGGPRLGLFWFVYIRRHVQGDAGGSMSARLLLLSMLIPGFNTTSFL